jgi:hypothetical protein
VDEVKGNDNQQHCRGYNEYCQYRARNALGSRLQHPVILNGQISRKFFVRDIERPDWLRSLGKQH